MLFFGGKKKSFNKDFKFLNIIPMTSLGKTTINHFLDDNSKLEF
jgi:hypothetical protein